MNEKGKSNVRVCARVRPLLPQEKMKDCSIVIGAKTASSEIVVGKGKEIKVFPFDYAFGPESTQSEIYQKCVHEMVEGCFEGYNATVFAYGQTGSGKTFTMGSGSTSETDEAGIIPRTISHIFRSMKNSEYNSVKLSCSYIEIYNEKINDLLHPEIPSFKIHIQKNEKGESVLNGIEEEIIDSESSIYNLLELGAIHRVTGANNVNEKSSRSHAIFTIYLSVIHCDGTVSLSKLHLVDLAGSEKTKQIKTKSDRFVESVAINQGLLTLGKVILCLSKISQGSSIDHIPYRESKLTRLLEDSLGGNSNTLMISCLSPADIYLDESLTTLRYATNTRFIKNKPKINKNDNMLLLKQLNNEINLLNSEIDNKEMEKLKQRNVKLEEELDQFINNNSLLFQHLNELKIQLQSLLITSTLSKNDENKISSIYNYINEYLLPFQNRPQTAPINEYKYDSGKVSPIQSPTHDNNRRRPNTTPYQSQPSTTITSLKSQMKHSPLVPLNKSINSEMKINNNESVNTNENVLLLNEKIEFLSKKNNELQIKYKEVVDNLRRDEFIFADKAAEIAKLKDQIYEYEDELKRREMKSSSSSRSSSTRPSTGMTIFNDDDNDDVVFCGDIQDLTTPRNSHLSKEAEEALADLNQRIREKEKIIIDLTTKNKNSSEELERYKNRISSLQCDIEKYKSLLSEINSQLEDNKNSLEEKDNQLEDLKHYYESELDNKLRELESAKCIETQSQISLNTSSKIQIIEEEVDRLKEKQKTIRETEPISVNSKSKSKINEIKLWFNGALSECIKEGYQIQKMNENKKKINSLKEQLLEYEKDKGLIDIKIMRRSLEQSENIQKFNERINKIKEEINNNKTSKDSYHQNVYAVEKLEELLNENLNEKNKLVKQSVLTNEEQIELLDVDNNIECLKNIIKDKENEFNKIYNGLIETNKKNIKVLMDSYNTMNNEIKKQIIEYSTMRLINSNVEIQKHQHKEDIYEYELKVLQNENKNLQILLESAKYEYQQKLKKKEKELEESLLNTSKSSVSSESQKQLKMIQKENYYYQLIGKELEEKHEQDEKIIKELNKRNKSLLNELLNLKSYLNNQEDDSVPKPIRIKKNKLKELKEVNYKSPEKSIKHK